MATILLQNAGAALGGVFGPFGAILGRAAGALAGAAIDQKLFGQEKYVSAPSLQGARISSADEGSPIARIYGTMRVAGNLIWATRFEEVVTVERQGGKGSSQPATTVESRNYYANFALGLCEGPIHHIKRVWADGRELDLSQIDMRIYYGSDDQQPDPLIEAKQGAGSTPAYRGLAYVVFDSLPIDNYGNRIPVLHFEVTRVISDLETSIKAVTLIPGATEHGLAASQISEQISAGERRFINHNVNYAETDMNAALDELLALCPNLQSIGLVISWFGNDLRAEHCTLRPGVEVRQRTNETRTWKVGNLNRSSAHLVSYRDGAPVYGGTPDDRSVLDAIAAIKARGLRVILYPFILMDIAEGNNLPSPYGGASQAQYPWRGRITCDPAIGESETVDQTALAEPQISNFVGTSSSSNFNTSNSAVSWSGGDSGYRHMILHYAALAQVAASKGTPVDGFVIGSEMVSLTKVRNAANVFPFVSALSQLAQDVRTMLGAGPDITYAADWSEYFGYHPQDGSGDVYFHLDDLWSNSAISSVGIDNYMPLSDWRDEDFLAANPDGFCTQNDVTALENQINGGEGYDWYYASDQDRVDRLRLPITDGLGKPWVYRYKDLRSWWQNQHFNRVSGAEVAIPTAWLPASKPIWFTEFGCPAVDKGANQPNVFSDPKSSENAFPYFSNQTRDDVAQSAYLKAHINHWNSDANQPQMVDMDNSFVWTWDARPYPAFPEQTDIWSDGENWKTGHWINGRLGKATLAELISQILKDHEFYAFDVSAVEGFMTGYVQNGVVSARSLLEPLLNAYQIDVREDDNGLVFSSRTRLSQDNFQAQAFVDTKEQAILSHRRLQEGELVNEMHLEHLAPETEYAPASAYSRRLSRKSKRQGNLALGGAIANDVAYQVSESWLQDHWASREVVDFTLPINNIALELGDRINLNEVDPSYPTGIYAVTQIEDDVKRQVSAKRLVTTQPTSAYDETIAQKSNDTNAGFQPVVYLLDLPILSGGEINIWARGAGFVKPWKALTLSSSTSTSYFQTRTTLAAPATMGELLDDLTEGPEGRFDYRNEIFLELYYGELETITNEQLLAGGNVIAVQSANGAYEIIQFQEAIETAPNQWRLSKLLRAQAGTDDAMFAGATIGAQVVIINDAVTSLGLSSSEVGNSLNWQMSANGVSIDHLDLISFNGGIRALTPLSPVHLKAERSATGIDMSWVRRSRFSADSWLGTDVPLDEDILQFQLDILDNGNAVRSIEVSDSHYFYDMSDELTDFGIQQSEITFHVRQLGGQVASGIVRNANITL